MKTKLLTLLLVTILTNCRRNEGGTNYQGPQGDGRQETLLPGSRHGGNGKARSDLPAE
ncbi:hypothetical protein [Luteolibacter soli]|uniref:hypothetical protein n=1 Tax=Luteolibacter soli TaxID=3135280 RepID=UPI00311960A0